MKRKEIREYTNLFQSVLGLNNWRVQVHFDRPAKSKHELDKFVTVAATHTNIAYKDASIYFHPSRLHLIDEETVLHELVHVLMAPFTQTAKETSKDEDSVDYYNEQMVSEITRVMLRLIYRKKQKIII